MGLGDAAFQTKPFSGQGVTSSSTACQIAAEVAGGALEARDASWAALWPYNVRYVRDQRATLASMFVQLPDAAELSRREVDFLFHSDLIFGSEYFEQMNRDYATDMSLSKTFSMGTKLLGGVIAGDFSWGSLQRLLETSGRAAKIRTLCERFLEDPGQFDAWVAEAKLLWGVGVGQVS